MYIKVSGIYISDDKAELSTSSIVIYGSGSGSKFEKDIYCFRVWYIVLKEQR